MEIEALWTGIEDSRFEICGLRTGKSHGFFGIGDSRFEIGAG